MAIKETNTPSVKATPAPSLVLDNAPKIIYPRSSVPIKAPKMTICNEKTTV